MDPTGWPHGGSWTPSTSDFPNEGGGSSCFLVDILEAGPLPTRYFLSSKACAGILRRAKGRGKELPPTLKEALETQAFRGMEAEGVDVRALSEADRTALLDLMAGDDLEDGGETPEE